MRNRVIFFCWSFIFGISSSAWAQISLDSRAFCSGVKHCLTIDLAGCSTEEKAPYEDVEYTPEFCEPFLNFASRGLSPISITSLQISSYLGQNYRVEYPVQGRLPINQAMMDYLMNHMPFTAYLINAYQQTEYTLKYTYGRKEDFHGDNGGSLQGFFKWVQQDSAGVSGKNLFWGAGRAKVLMWKLWGVAVMTLDYQFVDDSHIDYRLRPIVFPSNGFLNSIMHLKLFRNVVHDKIEKIVLDIENSARQFATGNRKPIEESPHFKKKVWLSLQLREFEKIVNTSGYGKSLTDLERQGKK